MKRSSLRSVRSLALLLATVTVAPAFGQATEAPQKPGARNMPVNTWVKVAKGGTGKWLSSIWYMPVTDEFISWGKYGSTAPDGVYDVLTFQVGDKRWKNSFPHGKEKAWAGQKWPNWNKHGYWSRMKGWKGPQPKGVYDHVVGGFMARNSLRFVETEGILRPTRCPTFHQGCWDSKRTRMVYFVGGQTFSYDPVKRKWTDLKPKRSPAWCQHLVWASLAYDAHNDEIMLFGGGMALNAWGGAKTWIYDCDENTWSRPGFGSPEVRGLRTKLEAAAARLRDTRGRVQYELGQTSDVRKKAVATALDELTKIGDELGTLSGAFMKADEAKAGERLAEVTKKVAELAGSEPGDGAHKLVWDLKALEADLAGAYRLARAEPPIRCNTQLVYDPKNKLIVLFGGDSQNAKLCDTWVYDVKTRTWRERYPKLSPPADGVLTATWIDKHGAILVAGFHVRRVRRGHQYTAWMYDAATNEWTPLKGTYEPEWEDWHSAAYSPKDDVVVLSCVSQKQGSSRFTYLYRLDPATARANRKGVANSSRPRYHLDFNARTRKLPAPDPEAHAKKLAELPANQWVQMPGPNVSRKGWGSATIDTEKSVILYIGGGHSTYSGTDTAHYDIGAGRWSLSYPPEFPPFLYGTNRTVYGWAYNLHPWAEHTRRWYAYDPVSKMMVYNRQGSIRPGSRYHLGVGEDGVVKATGSGTWVYNPRLRKWYPPSIDRPFGTGDSQHLCSTPEGIYAHTGKQGIWHCTVQRLQGNGTVRYAAKWTQIIKKAPASGYDLKGTTVYDSKRHRLIALAHSKYMTVIDLKTKQVSQLKPKSGRIAHYREAAYIPDQDVIFTPNGFRQKGYSVYRCDDNVWVKVQIASPVITYTHRGKTHQKAQPDAGEDTVILYDPRHKVLFRYGVGNTVHVMRYDDETVKTIGPK
jgi:hypothetical protein